MTGFASMFGGSGNARDELRLIVIDFFLAFALIWGAVFTLGIARSHAHAAGLPGFGSVVRAIAGHPTGKELAAPAPAARAVAGYTPRPVGATDVATYLLLSLTISALAALNLGFWRHLRRVYASPRRGKWRRG